MVSPAGSGAAPRWGAPSTDRGGSRDRFAAERHWRSLTPRHAVLEWMWENTPGSRGGPVLTSSCRKSQNGRCWFGAARKFRAQKGGKPRKSRKYVDENRQRPYNKSAGITPGGASVADRRLATPFTLLQHREGVMRMGNNRGTKALRFTICLVIVLAVAIALAPKAC